MVTWRLGGETSSESLANAVLKRDQKASGSELELLPKGLTHVYDGLGHTPHHPFPSRICHFPAPTRDNQAMSMSVNTIATRLLPLCLTAAALIFAAQYIGGRPFSAEALTYVVPACIVSYLLI